MPASNTALLDPDPCGGSPSISLDRLLPGSVPTVALFVRLRRLSARFVFHLDPQVGWFRCDRHSEVRAPSSLRDYLESLPPEDAERIAYEIEAGCLDWLAKSRGHGRPLSGLEDAGRAV